MKIIGIDSGTSNCAIALMRTGRAELIPPSDQRGMRVTPSVVSFMKGRIVVGQMARAQQETNPQFTYAGLKRIIGRRFDDPFVQEFAGLSSYGIVQGPNGEAWVKGPDKSYAPEELVSHLFSKLKQDAQDRLGEVVSHCVVAVPAHFGTPQKVATTDAAKRAGLEVVRIIDEPTAAALAYGMDKPKRSIIAVYDFGGGTFDVSIMRVEGRSFKILGRASDPFLGGMDFDRRLAKWLAESFEQQTGVDPLSQENMGALALQRLLDASETAKQQLSSVPIVPLSVKWLARDPETGKGIDLTCDVERSSFEYLCQDLIHRSIAPCQEALKLAKLAPSDIDDVLLVGGMTAMPAIRTAVQEIFGRTPRADLNPDEAVAFGCAIMGAALQGEVQSVALNEKITQSIGVGDAENKFVKFLKKNSSMPCEDYKDFTTMEDNQSTIAFPVYEGERDVASDNRLLGTLVIAGIEPAKAGDPQFRVRIGMALDGQLSCSLENKNPNNPAKCSFKIHTASGMSEEDIDALRQMEEAA